MLATIHAHNYDCIIKEGGASARMMVHSMQGGC